jgi:hypothetical protein
MLKRLDVHEKISPSLRNQASPKSCQRKVPKAHIAGSITNQPSVPTRFHVVRFHTPAGAFVPINMINRSIGIAFDVIHPAVEG